MYRKGGYIVGRIFGLLVILLMAALVAIQTPYVQTRLSKIALNQLAAIMDGRVQYDELKVMTSGVLVIRNIKLVDTAPYTEDANGRGWAPVDTVFRARQVTATFSIPGLIRGQGLHMGRVTVEDAFFHLAAEPGEYGNNISRIFHLGNTETEFPMGDIFDIKKLRIKDFRFRMNSFLPDDGSHTGYGFNFDDLDVLVSLLTGHGIRMNDGKIQASIDRCIVSEKSGYSMDRLSASAEITTERALIEDLHFRDPWSDLNVRSVSLSYDGFDALSDILTRVKIEADVQPSQLAIQTASYFMPDFKDNPAVLDIRRGQVQGYVNNLRISRLAFAERHSGISGTVDGTLTGLPDIEKLSLDMQVRDLKLTTEGVSKLASAFLPGGIPDIRKYARGIPLILQLSARGPVNEIAYTGALASSAGNASLSGTLRNLMDPEHPMEVDADASMEELDLGRLLGNDLLGPVTLRTRASAVLRNNGLPDARLDSLYISRIRALGHDFTDMAVSGVLRGGTAEFSLQSNDPAARLTLSGLADLVPRSGNQRLNLDGNLTNIDLRAFGIDGGDWISRLSTRVHTDMVLRGEFLDGEATLEGLTLINDSGTHPIGNINVLARESRGEQDISLDASFLEAYFTGNRPVTRFAGDIQMLTTRRELSALYQDEASWTYPGAYSLELLFHNTRDILDQFLPGTYIADGTSLSMTITEDGELDGLVQSDRLASGKNFLRDVIIQFDNRDGMLFANLLSQELRAGSFSMHNPAIIASAQDNDITLNVHYDGFSGGGGNAEIFLDGQLYRDDKGILVIKAHPLNSYLVAGDETWELNESDIVLYGKDLYLDRFIISNGPQSLLVDGGISSERSDTLTLQMDQFNLALIDQFLPQALGIEGQMDGRAFLTSGKDEPMGMLMDFRIDTLRIGGADAGTIQISSMWKDEGKELGLFLSDEIQGRDALYASGAYFPEENRVDLRVDLDALPLGIAAPFLSEFVTDVGGGVSGGITLSGPTDALVHGSEDLRLDDVTARLIMTGVPYTLSGPIRIDGSGVYFDDLQLHDDTGGYGRVSGGLRYRDLMDFDSFQTEARLSFTNLKVVDTPEQPGGVFYGLMRASGAAAVSGPFSSLLIDADVSTSGPGNIHIPLSSDLTSSSSNLLTFTEPVRELDPYEEMLASLEKKSATGNDMHIRGHVNIYPALATFVEIDKAAGNVASFNGSGSISLNIQPTRDILDLNGDYTINEGSYQFVLPGILSKAFTVQRGSSVKFGGDIMNTELDLTANYNLRTTLDALVGGENSASRRPVTCSIHVSDRLKSPQIDLDIDVPDLDPTTRTQVESALNSADKVQKQFVALLLMNNFLPNETSGISNQTTNLFSNVMSLLANQFNNILSKLDIPFDVALGYQGNTAGQDLFDVAVTTQLFDDRVIVGGSFGNRRFSTGHAASDFAGNLDISVKLDPEGKFRFNIFSHSADELTNYLDYSQRNGIGVSYQREYDGFRQFLRKLFVPKKKREKKEEEEALLRNQQIVIEIENGKTDESGETHPDSDTPRRKRSRRSDSKARP